MGKQKSADKKDLAYQLYITTEFTQAKIGDIIGTTDATISRWAKAGSWDEIRAALNSTHGAIVKGLYLQLAALNRNIQERADGYRYPSPEEVKAMQTINNTIRTMSKELSIAGYANVFKEFSKFLMVQYGQAKAQEFTELQMQFLKQKYNDL